MLKISSDARMASLDVRMVNPAAEENPRGKITKAAKKIAEIHKDTQKDLGTQIVFLDLGTPKAVDKVVDEGTEDGVDGMETASEQQVLRNVYGSLRRKLVAVGVPDGEIAFIHDAKDNKQRLALFERVNKGDIRVLIGSTGKLGVGVNVQKRAAALHHLDAPWRPRDIEQREGRIIRQGNEVYGPEIDADTGDVLTTGKGVRLYNYVTEGSFDAYMWQAIEAKAKAIKALMRRNVTARTLEDIDNLVLSASEAKALASGDPDVMRAVHLKNDVTRLEMVRASHHDSQVRARSQLESLPRRISYLQKTIEGMEKDAKLVDKEAPFAITVSGGTLKERPAAGEALKALVVRTPKTASPSTSGVIGSYMGFTLRVIGTDQGYRVLLRNEATGLDHATNPIPFDEVTPGGVVQRVENTASGIAKRLEDTKRDMVSMEASLQTYQEQAAKPFAEQERLDRLRSELVTLERKLQGEEAAAKAS